MEFFANFPRFSELLRYIHLPAPLHAADNWCRLDYRQRIAVEQLQQLLMLLHLLQSLNLRLLPFQQAINVPRQRPFLVAADDDSVVVVRNRP